MKKRILDRYKGMEPGSYNDLRDCINDAKLVPEIKVRLTITKENSGLAMEFGNINAKEIMELDYDHSFNIVDDLKQICITLPVTEHFFQGEDDNFTVILSNGIKVSKLFVLIYGNTIVQLNFDYHTEED